VFLPYIACSGAALARQVLVGRIVRTNEREFKQVSAAPLMTFALDCKPLTLAHSCPAGSASD
jgi:hypothetical protein